MESDVKDEESLGKSQYPGDISWEGSVLDRIETHFRLVMLSVRELELATRSTAEHVETMKSSLERQTDAVIQLAENMGVALGALREVLDGQKSVETRLSSLEYDVAELRKAR